MVVNIMLRTGANLPATFEMGEDELLTLALELQILRLYEQGDISSAQGAELVESARRALDTLLSAGRLRLGDQSGRSGEG